MQNVQIVEQGDIAGFNDRIAGLQTTIEGLQSRLAAIPDNANVGDRISDLEQGLNECHDALEQMRGQLTKLTQKETPDLTILNQEIATLKAKISALETMPAPPNPAPNTPAPNPAPNPQPNPPLTQPAPAAGSPTQSDHSEPAATISPSPAPNPNADPVARPAPATGFKKGHRLI